MAYYAIKGGEDAIRNSLHFYKDKIENSNNLEEEKIINSLGFAIDKILSEGSLYSKKLASQAIKRSAGDLLNAAFFLRAHRSSCQRIGICKPDYFEQRKMK